MTNGINSQPKRESHSGSSEERFVAFLKQLEVQQDRGSLAALRRGLGKKLPPAESLRRIVPYLPDQHWKHRWYFEVAALFAMHPESGGMGNLGDAYRGMGDHESATKRFVALLDSNSEDLPHRLRQAIALARSSDVPIDWLRLLRDLLQWEHPDRYVQRQWAQSYWSRRRDEDEESLESPTTEEG